MMKLDAPMLKFPRYRTNFRVTVPFLQERGFVLLLVLCMLVVTLLMTVGVARQSLKAALDVASELEELQDRWARYSLRKALHQVGKTQWLDRDPALTRKPAREVEGVLPLNGVDYAWRLGSEDAKVNLNTIYYEQGANQVGGMVRQLAALDAGISLRLRPYPNTNPNAHWPVYDSWGQVFESHSHFPATRQSEPWLWSATREITCWGSGKLHFRDASDRALRLTLRTHWRTSVIDELLSVRQQTPDLPTGQLLPKLALRTEEREAWQRLITEQRTCFSLWIWKDSVAGPRELEMCLVERGETGNSHWISFRW